jgi:ankyrin repeat protein
MLEVGNEINFTTGRLNETMLHIATRSGHTSCMKVLLDNNADANCIGKLILYFNYSINYGIIVYKYITQPSSEILIIL